MSGNMTRGWGSSRVISAKVCRTQVDVTSSTTLVDVPNCSHVLQSGGVYIIEAHITGVAGASGGAKVAITGDGGLTATAFTASAVNRNGASSNAAATGTNLGTTIAGSTAVFTDYTLLGSIVVAQGGRCTLQIAQNATNGTATSAYVGSYIKFTRVY